jgi:ATP-binding cassette subfamily B protein
MLVDDEEITTNNSRAWQKHVAHVPQYIFLADSSILENIAFGVPAELIDRDRVYLAAKQAQLHDLIIKWSQGYDTSVGERGIRLSGGQRQRIGIARALYKQANIIIFDEATSSLDNETEQSVMEAINQLSNELTLLIIAHRVTTLKRCDLIVSLENGTIKEIIQYDQIG